MNPIIVNVEPAKRRFGFPKRKQWQYTITGANGQALDPRDTYSNVGDIVASLRAFRDRPVRVQIHYPDETRVVEL